MPKWFRLVEGRLCLFQSAEVSGRRHTEGSKETVVVLLSTHICSQLTHAAETNAALLRVLVILLFLLDPAMPETLHCLARSPFLLHLSKLS